MIELDDDKDFADYKKACDELHALYVAGDMTEKEYVEKYRDLEIKFKTPGVMHP